MADPGVYPTTRYRVPSGGGYEPWLQQAYGADWRNIVSGGGRVPWPGDVVREGDPGYDLLSGGGVAGGNYRSAFYESDPRKIMESGPFQQLMRLASTGSGALSVAQQAMNPGMQWLQNMLKDPNPLGTGRGDLVRQEGLRALQTAVRTGSRQIDEEGARLGGAHDPTAASFAKGLLRIRGAEGYGGAVAAGKRAELDEQQLNKMFLKSLTETLQGYGGTYGQLAGQDFQSQIQALAQAGQLESFARNTWTEVLARLLGGGGPIQYSVEDRGRQRELSRFPEFTRFPAFFHESYYT